MGNCVGLTLVLKKRMKCVCVDDTKQRQFTLFGHYDALDIHNIDTWYQFRPRGMAGIEGQVTVDDLYCDKYCIKLYFPSAREEQDLSRMGFAYEIWRRIGARPNGELDTLFAEFPFISFAMINLSKFFVGRHSRGLRELAARMERIAARSGYDMENLHCALMPSLGFCDFVIMFLSNSPETVLKFLDDLKDDRESSQEDSKQHIIISECYPITGFEKNGLINISKFSLNNVKISIRINFREGASGKCFVRDAIEELKEDGKNIQFYHMFGKSDCLLLPEHSFKTVIPLYFNKKLFNPENAVFKKYICGIRSSVRIGGKSSADDVYMNDDVIENGYTIEAAADMDKYDKIFVHIIDQLTKTADEYKLPKRIIYGLQTLMKSFQQLIRSSHCFDLENIIGNAFETLKYDIDKNIKEVEYLNEQEKSASLEDKAFFESEKKLSLENLWIALELFREHIGEYLADMQRSDKSFIEGQSLSHPSIGSATKLLFFYNYYINDIAQKLVKQERQNHKRTYTFVVSSGGVDLTEAYDLFSHLNPADDDSASIIILKIPEMSLFDIHGTMFRLLHECLHFCGERNRIKRLDYVIQGISWYSALHISRSLGIMAGKLKKALEGSLKRTLNDKCIDSLMVKLMEKEAEELQKMQEELEEEIKNRLLEELDVDKYQVEDYFGRYLYNDIYNKAKDTVFVPVMHEDNLAHSIYKYFLRYEKNISGACTALLRDEGIFFSSSDILEKAAGYQLIQLDNGIYDEEIRAYIIEILERYLGKDTKSKDVDDDFEEVYFVDVLNNIRMTMKECYADCQAARILGAQKEDILLSLLYENKNMTQAFPGITLEILRRITEFHVLYGDAVIELSSLQSKINKWQENGYDYCENLPDHSADSLCKLMNKFSEEYEAHNYGEFMNPVRTYLEECLKLIDDNDAIYNDERTLYRQALLKEGDDLHNVLEKADAYWSMYAGNEGK